MHSVADGHIGRHAEGALIVAEVLSSDNRPGQGAVTLLHLTVIEHLSRDARLNSCLGEQTSQGVTEDTLEQDQVRICGVGRVDRE